MAMFAILHSLGMFVADMFKSRSQSEAENLFLRHQLAIGLRRASTQRIILVCTENLICVGGTTESPKLTE